MNVKPSSVEAVRALYENSAESYSRMMDEEIELPMYAVALSGLAQRIADIEGPILDSSCGSGHMLALLRDRYAPGRPLIGIDLSPRMVAISQERLGSAAEVRVGDMGALDGVPDLSCAATLNYFALHHVDLDAILVVRQVPSD